MDMFSITVTFNRYLNRWSERWTLLSVLFQCNVALIFIGYVDMLPKVNVPLTILHRNIFEINLPSYKDLIISMVFIKSDGIFESHIFLRTIQIGNILNILIIDFLSFCLWWDCQ